MGIREPFTYAACQGVGRWLAHPMKRETLGMHIRTYETRDLEPVVEMSLRAWEPVFASLAKHLAPGLYQHFFPDWRECQAKSVTEVCTDEKANVWVAQEDGRVAGFTAVFLKTPVFGEIYMIAVDPDFQRRGIGAKLTQFALDWMRQKGVICAMVETGADPGHAPARMTYEKAGFQLFPVARYFQLLG